MSIRRPTPTSSGSSAHSDGSKSSKRRPINYYDILAVSPTASYEEIRAGYRERIAQYHPDRHSSTHAHAIAALVNEAWEVLGDGERRRAYDAARGEAEVRVPLASRPGPPDAAAPRSRITPTAANRRTSRRLKTLVTTSLAPLSRIHTPYSATSTCVDLSINSMAFTLDRALEVGSAVTATLELPSGSLRIASTVVRSEPLRRQGRWKIAARFDGLRGPDRRRVAEYLAEVRRSRLP